MKYYGASRKSLTAAAASATSLYSSSSRDGNCIPQFLSAAAFFPSVSEKHAQQRQPYTTATAAILISQEKKRTSLLLLLKKISKETQRPPCVFHGLRPKQLIHRATCSRRTSSSLRLYLPHDFHSLIPYISTLRSRFRRCRLLLVGNNILFSGITDFHRSE